MNAKLVYVPIIKTTDAEIIGFENLSNRTKSGIVPLFELTKSRRTKSVPHGDIHRRMERISEIVGDFPFILDLTSHEDLMNPQIEDLLEEDDGFGNWYQFLLEYEHLNIIPIVHAYEDGDLDEVTKSARKLEERFGTIAFRADANDPETITYLSAIYNGIKSIDNLIVVIDAGYVSHGRARAAANSMLDRLNEINVIGYPGDVVVACSSFPSSVVQHPGGEDDHGEINMEEVDTYNFVSNEFNKSVCYGDYGGIHPRRYDTRGGTWIPRIDVSLEDTYIYSRYRREDGGYVRAANAMLNNELYQDIGSWGDDQIKIAAEGSPNGRSPSFWISVRLNIHITRHAELRNL